MKGYRETTLKWLEDVYLEPAKVEESGFLRLMPEGDYLIAAKLEPAENLLECVNFRVAVAELEAVRHDDLGTRDKTKAYYRYHPLGVFELFLGCDAPKELRHLAADILYRLDTNAYLDGEQYTNENFDLAIDMWEKMTHKERKEYYEEYGLLEPEDWDEPPHEAMDYLLDDARSDYYKEFGQ